MDVLRQAGLFALLTMFIGVVPLALAIVYAIWPTEQRLALMRPLSLATIFGAISGVSVGLLNVLRGIGMGETADFTRVSAIGLAESLVPVFSGFACLMAAWLCVAVGLWRRP
jgi:hypothetical protein